MSGSPTDRGLRGRRVLITGAARGIGAALAERLHGAGARVALLGLEPEDLAAVAGRCGGAPWRECDVTDGVQIDWAVEELVAELGGLDVLVANAGVAAQLPLVGGDPEVMARILDVNVMGVYRTIRAGAAHVSHPGGYVLVTSSLAAAVHAPLLGAYSASKAAVEALGNTLRAELWPTGAKVGVAYFAELDTDMTRRGFGTKAADRLTGGGTATTVTPLVVAIDALERGIARRARRIVAPRWVAPILPVRMTAQRVVDRYLGRHVGEAVAIARDEPVELTTPQADRSPAP